MIFRRRKAADTGDDLPVDDVEPSEDPSTADRRRAVGPWDVSEHPPDTDDPRCIDLGGMVITGREGLELRLQTDPSTQAVVAVMLVSQDGAVEVRAFAAGRTVGIWDDVRRDVAAEAARLGGTATETAGEYGTELRVVVPVQAPGGASATQTSRVVGIEGPRWLLRAAYLGSPATSPDPDHVLSAALRDVVVVRGQDARAPREPLPLRLPPNAQVVANDEE